jgi:hypothetical protein
VRIFEQPALRMLLEWVKGCRIQIEYHIGEDYKLGILIVQGCRPMHKFVPGGNVLGGLVTRYKKSRGTGSAG